MKPETRETLNAWEQDGSLKERAWLTLLEQGLIVDDLAALVRQLARALRKAAPEHDLPARAVDYLKRKGLAGSPLRKGTE